MGEINEINGYVRVTLDKLPGIRADLVRLDDDWQEWSFRKLVQALWKWCERKPLTPSDQANYERALPKPPKRRNGVSLNWFKPCGNGLKETR